MTSKRSHEGYLLIDNRNNEGVPDELLRAAGMPIGSGRGLFETKTITCSHCQVVVVLNPLRNRDRAYCRKCDHYICDKCGAAYGLSGGECFPYKKKVDEIQEQAALDEQRGSIIVAAK